jgi:hypothetical protein
MLVLAVVAGAVMVVVNGSLGGRPADAVGTPPPAPAETPSGPPAERLLIDDDLSQQRYWLAKELPAEKAACTFEGNALVAKRETKGLYRCAGPQDEVPADFRAEVGVRLLTTDSCAGIWFRFRPWRGYLVRICENSIFVGTHKAEGGVTTIRTFPLDQPIAVDAEPTRIGLRAVGGELELSRDATELGRVPLTDAGITGGRVLLGVYTERGVPQDGPYEVAFSDVMIWGPAA